MDPLTAVANMIASITELVKTVIASQPPEVQKQIWEWYVKDQAVIRKFFKMDQ